MIPLMKNAFFREKQTCKKLAKFIKKCPKLSMGEQCQKFEKEFSEFQGRKYSILVNSGGSANFLLLQALKNMGRIKEKDEIGFSALTWSTNVMPIIQHNFKPIPIDCSLQTLNISPKILKETIKEHKLKVLFITNVLGFTDDLFKIMQICKDNNIILLEDNCEALGTMVRDNSLLWGQGLTGNFGLASTFSFFVAHHMSTIEGGMICTDDKELAIQLVISRANGWDRNLEHIEQLRIRNKHNISDFESKYAFYDIGMNLRPTEITGFLGLEQLKYLQKNSEIRDKNIKNIYKVIKNNKDFITLDISNCYLISAFAIPIITKSKELKEKYLQKLEGKIETRPVIAGNITKQPFWKKYVKINYNLPNTDFIHENGFYFTNDPSLNRRDLKLIKEVLKGEN